MEKCPRAVRTGRLCHPNRDTMPTPISDLSFTKFERGDFAIRIVTRLEDMLDRPQPQFTDVNPRTRSTTGYPYDPWFSLPRPEQPSDAVIHLPCGGEKGDELLHHSQEAFYRAGQGPMRTELKWRA